MSINQSFYYKKYEKLHRIKGYYLEFCSRAKKNLTATGIELGHRKKTTEHSDKINEFRRKWSKMAFFSEFQVRTMAHSLVLGS